MLWQSDRQPKRKLRRIIVSVATATAAAAATNPFCRKELI